ncbi:MAG: DNA-directed RNA polymerase subunit omega, partial [Pseudomonadota bacterium]
VNGVEPLLPWENDKPTVMALREIADGLITHQDIGEKTEEEIVIDDEFTAMDTSPMSLGGE